MNAVLTFVHALSPLHAGTGQGVGVIDMPVAREAATGLPFLPGSSLKGSLRDQCIDADMCRKLFGPHPDTDNASDHAGSTQITDQRLLLLPVRSLAGVFAWVTSPYILRRFVRDAKDAGYTGLPGIPSPATPYAVDAGAGGDAAAPQPASSVQSAAQSSSEQATQQPPVQDTGQAEAGRAAQEEGGTPAPHPYALVAEDSAITLPIDNKMVVVLEDLDLSSQVDNDALNWADWLGKHIFSDDPDWQKVLKQRFCIVHEDVLSFLLQTALEVTARIRLKESTKTAAKGGLWYEEALPAETVLAGLAVATPVKWRSAKGDQQIATTSEILRDLRGLAPRTLQLGGKATVGRGLCRVRIAEPVAPRQVQGGAPVAQVGTGGAPDANA